MTARDTITFHLNGREVTALKGEPIIETARREGVAIPHLCYKPGGRSWLPENRGYEDPFIYLHIPETTKLKPGRHLECPDISRVIELIGISRAGFRVGMEAYRLHNHNVTGRLLNGEYLRKKDLTSLSGTAKICIRKF